MRIFLIVLCFFTCTINGLGQERRATTWRLGVRAGWNSTILSDSKLNPLRYSGHNYLGGTVQGLYSTPKARILLAGHASNATLHVDCVEQMYDYNSVNHRYTRLTTAYLHRVFAVNKKLNLFAGAGNSFLYANGDQHFRSLLYPQGRKERKSYIFSPLSLSIIALVEYKIGSSNLSSSVGYTCFNLAKRPNDNYVKQIGTDYNTYWTTSHFPDFSGLQYSLTYFYSLGKIGPSIGYDLIIDKADGYKSFQRLITVGVTLMF